MTLITTTTHMLIPHSDEYDAIDLSGSLFRNAIVSYPGIYVGGSTACRHGKMTCSSTVSIGETLNRFDLVLIEGDGAAGKQLKG